MRYVFLSLLHKNFLLIPRWTRSRRKRESPVPFAAPFSDTQ